MPWPHYAIWRMEWDWHVCLPSSNGAARQKRLGFAAKLTNANN